MKQKTEEKLRKEAQDSIKEEIQHLQQELEQAEKPVQERPRTASNVSSSSRKPTQDHKEKLKKIKEQGLKMYKQRLLEQLDSDCQAKLRVLNFLFLLALAGVGFMYYGDLMIEVRLQDLLV